MILLEDIILIRLLLIIIRITQIIAIGYSVNHEESDGGAVEELLPYFLV